MILLNQEDKAAIIDVLEEFVRTVDDDGDVAREKALLAKLQASPAPGIIDGFYIEHTTSADNPNGWKLYGGKVYPTEGEASAVMRDMLTSASAYDAFRVIAFHGEAHVKTCRLGRLIVVED